MNSIKENWVLNIFHRTYFYLNKFMMKTSLTSPILRLLFIQMIYKHIILGIFPNIAENFVVNEFVFYLLGTEF